MYKRKVKCINGFYINCFIEQEYVMAKEIWNV